MKMDPDGAGEDSSAAGRLDGARLRVTVEPAEALEAAAALTSPIPDTRPHTRPS